MITARIGIRAITDLLPRNCLLPISFLTPPAGSAPFVAPLGRTAYRKLSFVYNSAISGLMIRGDSLPDLLLQTSAEVNDCNVRLILFLLQRVRKRKHNNTIAAENNLIIWWLRELCVRVITIHCNDLDLTHRWGWHPSNLRLENEAMRVTVSMERSTTLLSMTTCW